MPDKYYRSLLRSRNLHLWRVDKYLHVYGLALGVHSLFEFNRLVEDHDDTRGHHKLTPDSVSVQVVIWSSLIRHVHTNV